MEFRKPTWRLRALCPVCSQGSCLALVSCPTCSHLAVVCEEEGSVFLDPKTLAPASGTCDDLTCPSCAGPRVSEFATATDTRVQASGLTVADYE